jgi:hypothetical protein
MVWYGVVRTNRFVVQRPGDAVALFLERTHLSLLYSSQRKWAVLRQHITLANNRVRVQSNRRCGAWSAAVNLKGLGYETRDASDRPRALYLHRESRVGYNRH